MKMKTFIPNIEDQWTSDESGDEIPPGGVFPLGGIQAVEEEEEDLNEHSDNEDNVEPEVNGDAEENTEAMENEEGNDSEEGELEENGVEDDSDEKEGEDDDNEEDNDNEQVDNDKEGPDEEDEFSDLAEEEDEFVEMGSDSDDNDNDDDDDDANEEEDNDSSDEDMETMESLFGIKPNVKPRKAPPDYDEDSGVLNLCFHPREDLLCAATMDGDAVVYKYNDDLVEEVSRYTHHKESCRSVFYDDDGTTLYTVSKDCSFAIVDTQTATPIHHFKEAHESPLYSFRYINENLCATGDDDGTVKMWDIRKEKSVFKFKCDEGTITSMVNDGDGKYLCVSVSDGSIAGFDIRQKQLEMQSEIYDTGMNSLALVRNESKLLVGTEMGACYIFNWGEFGYHIDRFSGVKEEIHCLLPISDRLIFAGYEDGNIRAMHLYPHRFLGIIGEHKSFGVDCLAKSRTGNLVASCSMDGLIRFWNIEYMYRWNIDPEKKGSKERTKRYLTSSRQRNPDDFFRDLPKRVESDNEDGPFPGPSGLVEDSDSD